MQDICLTGRQSTIYNVDLLHMSNHDLISKWHHVTLSMGRSCINAFWGTHDPCYIGEDCHTTEFKCCSLLSIMEDPDFFATNSCTAVRLWVQCCCVQQKHITKLLGMNRPKVKERKDGRNWLALQKKFQELQRCHPNRSRRLGWGTYH